MRLARQLWDQTLRMPARRLRHNVRMGLISSFGRTPGLASLYFATLSAEFRREHRATLAGQHQASLPSDASQRSDPQLRRGVHRLEKGLVMRPRKPVFATDYIEEVVERFGQAYARSGAHGDLECAWAHDVLAVYFDAVEHTDPAVQRAHRAFRRVLDDGPPVGSKCPYPRESIALSRTDPDQFSLLCRQRRSTRFFLPTDVPDNVLHESLADALQAPSACNRQPFRVIVCRGSERAKRVAGLAGGTVGFSDQLRCVAVIVGRMDCFLEARDRHVIYIDASLMAMQWMLSLETRGLASCPINWPDVESRERAIADELSLAVHERVIMLMAIGYPDPTGGIPYSAKKSTASILELVE